MRADQDQRKRVRAELQSVFETAKLPTSPAIAKKILGLIDNPYSTAEQFAKVIEADPALAARLLKVANSARYAQRQKVTTIQRAVTVIGLGQLRVVALGFELVGHLDRLGATAFDLRSFWEQAVFRACLARSIAVKVVPALAEEAFLVGLLQDCGVLPLVQALGRDYAELYQQHADAPGVFFIGERKRFPYTHVDAIAALVEMWQLPEVIAEPLIDHHRRVRLGARSPDHTRLCAVSYFVGSIGGPTADTRIESIDHALFTYALNDLKLDRAAIVDCLEECQQSYSQVSPMIHQGLDEDMDVAELLVVANRHLQRHAAESEDRVRAVEADRDQVLDEQVTLRSALGQYREQAARDPLTGLLNRRALLDAGAACLRTAHQQAGTIAVMFIDVDDFKQINDTLGHHAGDEVLKAVAQRLVTATGQSALVGRYGGEEFVVIWPGLIQDEARQRADGLVAAIRTAEPADVTVPEGITASMGAVWCSLDQLPSGQLLIGEADKLMYVAKRAGKDHCCFRAVPAGGLAANPRPKGATRDGSMTGTSDGIGETSVPPAFSSAAAQHLERRSDGSVHELFPCIMRCLSTFSPESPGEQVYAHSIEGGHLGVLIDRPMVRDDVVEICIEYQSERTYILALVADSRHLDGVIHDLDLQEFKRSDQPILSADGELTTDVIDPPRADAERLRRSA